jgi:dUTP pyrophosphatase
MKIKFIDGAKEAGAKLPVSAYNTDTGYDIVTITDGEWNESRTFIEYRTGITIEVPRGYHVELFPRSSISNYDLTLANSIGLVDWGYRNEIIFRFKYIPRFTMVDGVIKQLPAVIYKKGERIGQIVVRKTERLQVEEVTALSDTDRNIGGFGSSGK